MINRMNALRHLGMPLLFLPALRLACLFGFSHKLIKFIAGIMMRFVPDFNAGWQTLLSPEMENLIKECRQFGRRNIWYIGKNHCQ